MEFRSVGSAIRHLIMSDPLYMFINRAVRLDPVGKLRRVVGKIWLGWAGASGSGESGGTSLVSEAGSRRVPKKHKKGAT